MPLIPKWTATPNLPTGNITLLFSGMMALCENSEENQYEFLCHGESNGTRSHELKITIDGIPLSDTKFDEFKFYILNKETGELSNSNPIAAFIPSDPTNIFSFNHIIDIEQIYGRELKKKSPLNRTNRITVKNGIIHTAHISDYEFSLVDNNGNEIMPPRQITLELGINISLADNERGILKWFNDNETSFTKEFDNTNNHQIRFYNFCSDISSPDLKCKDSDFSLNYENIIDEVDIIKHDLKKHINIMSGENAPCTETGFGETKGWNPPPPTGSNP